MQPYYSPPGPPWLPQSPPPWDDDDNELLLFWKKFPLRKDHGDFPAAFIATTDFSNAANAEFSLGPSKPASAAAT